MKGLRTALMRIKSVAACVVVLNQRCAGGILPSHLNMQSQLQAKGRKAMPGFEDKIRSSAPGGNIGKPLMARALAALLASAALFRGSGAGQLARARNRPRTRAPVDCLVD